MNWEEAGLSLSKREGFVLTDAIISVFIVSVMASLLLSLMTLRVRSEDSIREESERMEEAYRNALDDLCGCVTEEE